MRMHTVIPFANRRSLSGLGDDVSPDSVKSLLTDAINAYQALRIQDVNLDRAAKGLAPIDAQAYAPAVNVGLDSGTQQLVTYALWGAGIYLLIKLLSR